MDGRSWQVIAILALVAVAYLPALHAGFIWDDDDYLLLNPLVVEKGGWQEIWNPSSPYNPQYYPLVFTTFKVEHALWASDPLGYHVVNVILHCLNALLLWVVLRRLGLPGAWLAAAIFAVHPVHVESVMWITERKNVLSAFFYLLAALGYLRFDETGRRRWYLLALLAFLLALFSKTVTASLPVALALLLWWAKGRVTWRQAFTLTPMLLLGAILGLLTRQHEARHVLAQDTVLDQWTVADRIRIAGRALWFYPSKIVWPADLAFIYPRWEIPESALWPWLFPLAAATAVAVLSLLVARGRARGAAACCGFYLCTIFPALGFVNVAPLRFSFVADHFQYLASIGIIVLAVAPLAWIRDRPWLRRSAGAILLLLLVTLAHAQATHYRDSGTLWEDTLRKNPGHPMVLNSYGSWLLEHGRYDEAERRFLAMLEIPDLSGEYALLARSNLAASDLARGRYDEGLGWARAALAVKSDFPYTLSVYGRLLWRSGRPAEAEAVLTQLLELAPDPRRGRAAWDFRRRVSDAEVLYWLGKIQRERGALEESVSSLKRAIELDPDFLPAYLELGDSFGVLGRFEDAASLYRQVLERDPHQGRAHLQLAQALVLLGRPQEALASFDQALKYEPENAFIKRARAQLLMRLGDERTRRAE